MTTAGTQRSSAAWKPKSSSHFCLWYQTRARYCLGFRWLVPLLTGFSQYLDFFFMDENISEYKWLNRWCYQDKRSVSEDAEGREL